MKTPIAAALLLALSTTLGAQETAHANPVTMAFRARIGALSREVAQALDSIPESKYGFRPTPSQMTIGDVAQHVAEDNYLFCDTFGPMKADIPPDEKNTPDSVKATWPKATLMTQLGASFAYCARALDQVDDAKLAGQTTLTYGGRTMKVGLANMVLEHALDLADHYSQLANYMRLNGLLPPTALPRPKRGNGQ